jgi:DNA adenine methylase
MGSKARIAKHIVPIIQSYIDASEKKIYWEPFCGGCNVMEHIVADTKIGSDKQQYLIALLQNLDKLDTLPEFVDKAHYTSVKICYNTSGSEFEPWYIGAIGFLASYNGKFFDGGYGGVETSKSGKVRNRYDEAKRNLLRQKDGLSDVQFHHWDYEDAPLVSGAVIYCDPPYRGTTQYESSRDFDHDDFWAWVRKISNDNVVIVSEQSAPPDMKCIWEAPVTRVLAREKRFQATEKLYTYNT